VSHPKHNEVRTRFHARCGYCGVREDDVGGELTVDHFVPVSAGGDDSDDNLVYACFRCNLFKSDFSPTDKDRSNGHVLLHPLRDNLAAHVRLDETTGRVEPLSETGRFQIALLHLNRPALIRLRLRQRHQALLQARRTLLEAEIKELRAIITAQEKYITYLKSLFDLEPDEEI
jgi:HNH endonuclease